MRAKANDLAKRVDILRITFPVKRGSTRRLSRQPSSSWGSVPSADGQRHLCHHPAPFDWSKLPVVASIDKVVEDYVVKSLRSQSWEVKVVSYRRQGFNINRMIEEMQARKASDLHLRAGTPPYIRVDNDLMPLDMPAITYADMQEIVYQLGSQAEVDRLEAERESSFQFHAAGIGYLRCSGYFKQGAMALAVRLIPKSRCRSRS